jgi:hypothetical protein
MIIIDEVKISKDGNITIETRMSKKEPKGSASCGLSFFSPLGPAHNKKELIKIAKKFINQPFFDTRNVKFTIEKLDE